VSTLSKFDIVEQRFTMVKPGGRNGEDHVTYQQIIQALDGISPPHKLSVKRHDQPFEFFDNRGNVEVRRERQY